MMFKSKKINALIEKYKLKPKFFFVKKVDDTPIATVCVLQEDDDPNLRIGVSILHPIEKSFNKERGRAIALGRAFHCFIRNGKPRKKRIIRGVSMFMFSLEKNKLVANETHNIIDSGTVGVDFFGRWKFVQSQAIRFYDRIYDRQQKEKATA